MGNATVTEEPVDGVRREASVAQKVMVFFVPPELIVSLW